MDGMDRDELVRRLDLAELTLEEYHGFTDETVTDSEISLMRKHGIPTPSAVSEGRWVQPIVLSPRHKKIIYLAASGKMPGVIAEEVGMSKVTVLRLLKSPLFKQKIEKKAETLYDAETKSYMKMLMNQAFANIQDILEDPDAKASVKLEAAKYVIDHNIGKAAQTVEVSSGKLNELIRRLDSERAVKQIEATPDEPAYADAVVSEEIADVAAATALKVLENKVDDMDTLVDRIIEGGLVVGRRDKDGSGTK